MTDKIVLGSISSFQNDSTAAAQYNANNALITTAMDNTLSLNGLQPNSMQANFDMNSNQILNLPTPSTGASPLRVQDYNTLLSGGTITVQGVPTGGTTGQVLDKNSNTNFDTGWVTPTVPIATGVTGLGAGVAAFLATPSTANLATAVTGETGTGALVFGTNPTLTSPTITTPTFSAPLSIANGGTADTGTAWTNYSPVIGATSGTFTTVLSSGRYKVLGKTIFVSIVITDTTTGTAAGQVTATLPFAPIASNLDVIPGININTANTVTGLVVTSGGGVVAITKYDGTFPLANGQSLVLSGVYESI